MVCRLWRDVESRATGWDIGLEHGGINDSTVASGLIDVDVIARLSTKSLLVSMLSNDDAGLVELSIFAVWGGGIHG